MERMQPLVHGAQDSVKICEVSVRESDLLTARALRSREQLQRIRYLRFWLAMLGVSKQDKSEVACSFNFKWL